MQFQEACQQLNVDRRIKDIQRKLCILLRIQKLRLWLKKFSSLCAQMFQDSMLRMICQANFERGEKINKVGDRIGAMIGKAEDGFIDFLGYGTYAGMEIPPEGACGFAKLCHDSDTPLPKLILDNGDIVWGGECWWGGEEQIKLGLSNQKVRLVRIQECRDIAKLENKKEQIRKKI